MYHFSCIQGTKLCVLSGNGILKTKNYLFRPTLLRSQCHTIGVPHNRCGLFGGFPISQHSIKKVITYKSLLFNNNEPLNLSRYRTHYSILKMSHTFSFLSFYFSAENKYHLQCITLRFRQVFQAFWTKKIKTWNICRGLVAISRVSFWPKKQIIMVHSFFIFDKIWVRNSFFGLPTKRSKPHLSKNSSLNFICLYKHV